MDEQKAKKLSELLGGNVWHSGGGIFLVTIKRKDGKQVVFSDEVICEYVSEDALNSGEYDKVISLI